MKKVIIILFCALAVFTTVNAQNTKKSTQSKSADTAKVKITTKSTQTKPADTAKMKIITTQKVAVDTPKIPEISFESLNYDYGTVPKGSNGKGEFKFTNTGNGPLLIKGVNSSCSCLVPTWSSDTIKPGKKGVIKVNYTMMSAPGTISKKLTVFTNAKSSPFLMLSISGTVLDSPAENNDTKKEGVNPQKNK